MKTIHLIAYCLVKMLNDLNQIKQTENLKTIVLLSILYYFFKIAEKMYTQINIYFQINH